MDSKQNASDQTHSLDLTQRVYVNDEQTLTLTLGQLKLLIETFYMKHNPEKVGTIDVILFKYLGKESKLIQNLSDKYQDDVLTYLNPNSPPIPHPDPPPNPNPNLNPNPNPTSPPESAQHTPASSHPSTPTRTSSPTANLYPNPHPNTNANPTPNANPSTHPNSNPNPNPNPNANLNPRVSIVEGVSQMTSITGKLLTAFSKSVSGGLGIEEQSTVTGEEVPVTLQSRVKELEAENANLGLGMKKLHAQIATLKRSREKTAQDLSKALSDLSDLTRQLESSNSDLSHTHTQTQTLTQTLDKTNSLLKHKHTQLLTLLSHTHTLTSQLHFLTSKIALEANPSHNPLPNPNPNPNVVPTPTETAPNDSQVTTETAEQALCLFTGEGISVEGLSVYVRSLAVSLRASRDELRLVISEKERAEACAQEQHLLIQQLQAKVSELTEELRMASGSTHDLTQRMLERDARLAAAEADLTTARSELNTIRAQVADVLTQLQTEREINYASATARRDLTNMCTRLMRECEERAQETVREMSERVLCEREEALTRLSVCASAERRVRQLCEEAAQEELHRLSTELFQSRQREAMKEREVRHLQRQLKQAAEQFSQAQSPTNPNPNPSHQIVFARAVSEQDDDTPTHTSAQSITHLHPRSST